MGIASGGRASLVVEGKTATTMGVVGRVGINHPHKISRLQKSASLGQSRFVLEQKTREIRVRRGACRRDILRVAPSLPHSSQDNINAVVLLAGIEISGVSPGERHGASIGPEIK